MAQHEIKINLSNLLKTLSKGLYTESDVAVRELIQNANDTCIIRQTKDKSFTDLRIEVSFDKAAKTLTFSDNGAGMTATVDDCVFLGLNTHYFVHFEDGEEAEIIQESTIDSSIAPGTKIKLVLNTAKVNIFTADGSENLLRGVCNDCAGM